MRRRHLWFGLWLALMMAWDSGAWGQTLEEYDNEGRQRYNRSDFRGALEAWEQGLALAKDIRQLQAASLTTSALSTGALVTTPRPWNSTGRRWRLPRLPPATGRGKGQLSIISPGLLAGAGRVCQESPGR